MPSATQLEAYYASKYYQENNGGYKPDYGSEELQWLQAKIELRYQVVKSHLSPAKSGYRLLDVGCGEGYVLNFFRKLGWEVSGIDYSSAGILSKNPDCLDVLKTGDIFTLLSEEVAAGNTYDVIWLQNVLEHVLDPIALLKTLHSIVSNEGVAVVTVPNDCSIVQLAALEAQHVSSAFWLAPPDHLTHFDPHTLSSTVEYTGWKCFRMLGDFPVDWFLFHPGSNYVRDQSVGHAAHRARIQIENLINLQPIEDVIEFWAAAAKIGIGRDITCFMKHEEMS